MVVIAVFQSLGKMNFFCIFCQTQMILSPIVRVGGRGRGDSDDKEDGKRKAWLRAPFWPPR